MTDKHQVDGAAYLNLRLFRTLAAKLLYDFLGLGQDRRIVRRIEQDRPPRLLRSRIQCGVEKGTA